MFGKFGRIERARGWHCAFGPSFAMVLTRAPMDTGSRREDSKAVRDEILGPQDGEMRCKMECLVTVRCRYSSCRTDDFVFSTEFGRRSACEGPFDLIRGPLGTQNAFG